MTSERKHSLLRRGGVQPSAVPAQINNDIRKKTHFVEKEPWNEKQQKKGRTGPLERGIHGFCVTFHRDGRRIYRRYGSWNSSFEGETSLSTSCSDKPDRFS
uniref:Uncharacterized protein n=1 Tax=Nelumbo nucifera TaxID=4432 RepID=A0A822YC43_NELNU|nr:TPA_asm: hypothetical protein HUJ06_030559 [Nelumbo nucifera]